MVAEVQDILNNPLNSLFVIFNLILIESLLSIDNATVLAVMVKNLEPEDKNKALKYGIWGAYIFRGLALLFAAKIMTIWWLKPLGGLYLIYITISWWIDKKSVKEEEEEMIESSGAVRQFLRNFLSPFWTTVILVELMDLAFSIDNVFAAVAFSDNLLIVCIGVFIGILAMRFIAQYFVKLIETYPFLEYSAFLVILVLGLKLLFSAIAHYTPESSFAYYFNHHLAEVFLSSFTVLIFIFPLITSKLFNIPKHK